MKLIEQSDVAAEISLARSGRGRIWMRLELGAQVYYLDSVEAKRLADKLVDVAEFLELDHQKIREEK